MPSIDMRREYPEIFYYIDESVDIRYNDVFREFSLGILDGGSSRLVIKFCPFTGKKLPESLRDEWFDKLNEIGIYPNGPFIDENIPLPFTTDNWWNV
jgi:hypothetical protein